MIKGSGLIFCILIYLIQIPSCAQKEENCSLFYKEYNSNRNSDTLDLIQILNRIISSDSLCINALLTRGDIFFSIDSINSAKEDYLKVLSLDPSNVYSMYQIGMLFNARENYDSAIIFFQKAIDVKSNGTFIYDHTNERFDPKAKYDIEANELLFSQGISFYYGRKLNEALKNFSYTIYHNYKLDRSYLYRAAILIELGSAQGDPCSDLYEAKRRGNKDADSYIAKYCKPQK